MAKAFDRAVKRSGLPRVRFHDLRHSHCSHLVASGGVPLPEVTRRLGHASVALTLSHYAHVGEDAGAAAAASVEAMIYGAGS